SFLDGCPRFPIGVAALDRLALVVVLLALGEADRHLDAPFLEVHPDGDQRHPLLDRLANQLLDLLPVQQELPLAGGLVIAVAAVAVGADVDVLDPHFAPPAPREAAAERAAPLPNRLALGPEQSDARLESLDEVI